MSRPFTRTEQIDPQAAKQLEEFLTVEHHTYSTFHAAYLPDMKYQLFRHALQGYPMTPETLDSITAALDAAGWAVIRRDRTQCPHCNGSLL